MPDNNNKTMSFPPYYHGFDLTLFKKGGFQAVLGGLRIKLAPIKSDHKWTWKNAQITIVTTTNPISGDDIYGQRELQEDYAGYMGLRANDRKLLKLAVTLIRRHAEHSKDESEGNSAFISVPVRKRQRKDAKKPTTEPPLKRQKSVIQQIRDDIKDAAERVRNGEILNGLYWCNRHHQLIFDSDVPREVYPDGLTMCPNCMKKLSQ